MTGYPSYPLYFPSAWLPHHLHLSLLSYVYPLVFQTKYFLYILFFYISPCHFPSSDLFSTISERINKRNEVSCYAVLSVLFFPLIGPNVVLSIAFPDTFLTKVTQTLSTLFVIIFNKYLLFLSYITTYLTKFSYVTNVRQLFSYEIALLFQWGLSKKKANGNRSGTSNVPVIVRHCLELQRLLQATNHLSYAGQDNRHN